MKSIYTKQNDESILILQFLSRKSYNKASVINLILWVLSILSALVLPSLETLFLKYLGKVTILILPWLVVGLVYYLEKKVVNMVSLGADTKELIDRTLFEFALPDQHDFSKDKIVELAINEKQKNRKEYEIAVKNTGEDKPKGVRNWYSEKQATNPQGEILLCQKENRWFDNSISTTCTYLCLFILSTLSLGLFFFFKDFTLISVLFTISSYSSLIIKLISDISKYREVKRIGLVTETLIEHAERNEVLTNQILKDIQKNIYKRRKINYVPLNFIHTIQSTNLHSLWREKLKYE